MVYQKYYPFGEERGDIQAAIIACVIANVNRGKKTKPYKIDDFIPNYDPPKQQSVDDMKNILKGLCK